MQHPLVAQTWEQVNGASLTGQRRSQFLSRPEVKAIAAFPIWQVERSARNLHARTGRVLLADWLAALRAGELATDRPKRRPRRGPAIPTAMECEDSTIAPKARRGPTQWHRGVADTDLHRRISETLGRYADAEM